MTRPTKEQVDEVLDRIVDNRKLSDRHQVLLLSEVRALREELSVTTGALQDLELNGGMQLEDLRQAIARVEALPAKWRKDATELSPENAAKSLNAQCFINAATSEFAKELEAALKGLS